MRGLRPAGGASAELKRVYVRPEFRGRRLGRRLTLAALRAASRLGYRRVVLDTLPKMSAAIRLYRSLGFIEIPPYWDHPVPGAIFFAKRLKSGRGPGRSGPAAP